MLPLDAGSPPLDSHAGDAAQFTQTWPVLTFSRALAHTLTYHAQLLLRNDSNNTITTEHPGYQSHNADHDCR